MNIGRQELGSSSENLTAQTFSGLQWSYSAAVSGALVQFAYVAAMSRLLDPAAFGLMAIATLAINFGLNLNRMGIAQALIQKEDVSEQDVRAAATGALMLGLTSATVLWLLAPLIAVGFFNEPGAVALLRAMAATFVFDALGNTSQAMLRRELRFREIGIIEVATSLAGLLVGVVTAVLGAGVWSLVAAALLTSAARCVLRFVRARHSLVPVLRWGAYQALFGYGVRISAIRFLDFLARNMDTFAVGRYAGSAAVLGQYNRAFYLVSLPVNRYLAQALTTVLFPGLARAQSDIARLGRAYTSIMRLGGMVLLPVCAGLAAAAPELVRVVLGDQWDAAIALIPWFAAAACLTILTKVIELACEARAELNRMLALQATYLLVFVGLLALAIGREAVAFAIALTAGELLRHLAFMVLARRLLGIHLARQGGAYVPGAVGALGVGATVLAVQQPLRALHAPDPVTLVVCIAAAALALALCIRFNPVGQVRRDLRQRLTAGGTLRGRGARAAALLLGPDRRPRPAQSTRAPATGEDRDANGEL